MPKSALGQHPLDLRNAHKTDTRAQVAALCWRKKKGKVQICLITSRGSKRWIIPKGWPIHNHTPSASAAVEAFEEAGLQGFVSDQVLGIYGHRAPDRLENAPILTMVFPMQVDKVRSDWPERKQRRRKWFSIEKASKKVDDPALRAIIQTFKANRGKR